MTIGRQTDFMPNTNTPKQNVLERLHKRSISAKDIAGQFWCEKQMELSYIHGFAPTKIMNAGTEIHQKLQVEVFKPLELEPVSYPDRMYKTAYENILTLKTLEEKGVARELKIYGSINGYTVVGQVDELRMSDGKVVIVENKTTNSTKSKFSPQYTKPHEIQIMLYKRMLDDLKSGSYSYNNFNAYYKVSGMRLSDGFAAGLKAMGINDSLINVGAIFTKMFERIVSLSELSNALKLNYVGRETRENIAEITVNYDRESLSSDIVYAMKYWNGERDAAPVPEEEKWKCNVCRFFGKQCFVWFER
jgi:exonuclease V